MAPTQLLRQCRNNSLIGEQLGQLDHSKQVETTKACAVIVSQLACQRCHYLFAVLRAFLLQYRFPNPGTNPPIQADERRVDRASGLVARRFDQRPDVA